MPAVKTDPSPSLRTITEDLLKSYVERDERRKELEREARQLGASIKIMADQIERALDAAEKPEVTRGEFRAGFKHGQCYVAWKEHFIKVAGDEAAIALQKAAAPSRRLEVARIGG